MENFRTAIIIFFFLAYEAPWAHLLDCIADIVFDQKSAARAHRVPSTDKGDICQITTLENKVVEASRRSPERIRREDEVSC